jgi:NAD-dependent SIR2 family protein deacetylase
MGKQLRMDNGDVADAFAGMALRCTGCDTLTEPTRREDDPKSVVRCAECGKRHSTASLEWIGE